MMTIQKFKKYKKLMILYKIIQIYKMQNNFNIKVHLKLINRNNFKFKKIKSRKRLLLLWYK